MSENPVLITNLNDFVFCPASIYFHALDCDTEKLTYRDECQINGTKAHEKSDSGMYSDRTGVMQAVSVFSQRYGLIGKIDVFDSKSGVLTERKKRISTVYDGYVFQLYAQCFALREMDYEVASLRLYSMDDNKSYDVKLPENDLSMLNKFECVVEAIKSFDFDGFVQDNPLKCVKCIYEPLCSYSQDKQVIF